MVLAAAIAVLLVALGVFAWSGPVLVVRDVKVEGLSAERTAAVVDAANVTRGERLLQLDTAGIRGRVHRLPFVARVTVHRRWPSTVVIRVDARTPAAAVPVPGGGYRLVDERGVVYTTLATRPAGLPVIRLTAGGDPTPTLVAALTVLRGLPAGLRHDVAQVSADSPQDISLRIGKATVRWGGPDRTDRKAAVFQVLRRTKASVYDVSSPDTPVLR